MQLDMHIIQAGSIRSFNRGLEQSVSVNTEVNNGEPMDFYQSAVMMICQPANNSLKVVLAIF